jgi:PTS system cellobiose-specific IIA component
VLLLDYEMVIMQLIVNSGNARSMAMEAIQLAKQGDIAAARIMHKQAVAELTKTHEAQTQLIQEEAGGNLHEITLLMIHAQDHLMSAISIKDLALEFIDLYEKIQK